MRVKRKDFSWAVSRGVISEGQAEDLWRVLERRNTNRPRFDLPHVAYYFGALVVISAMTWFMTLGWEIRWRRNIRDLAHLCTRFRGRWWPVVVG
jgi:hypothetical protein